MENETETFSDAVMYGDFDLVKEMIAERPEVVHSKDKYGFTALHNVMSEEQFEIVQYLIDHGADVNAKNQFGTAPLHLACYRENADLLLKAGADINLADNKGNTPLHVLASDGEERLDVIRFLLSKGADKNLKNKFGDRPMDISVSRKDKKVIGVFERG